MVKLEIKTDTKDIESVKKLVETAINSEIKNLQRCLTKTDKILGKFEGKYKTTSELFLTNYTGEDMEGGDEKYIQWFGEIKIKEKLINSLQKLQNIEYVS
jgi:hypothetical protein